MPTPPTSSIPTAGTAPASVPKDARGEVQQFVGGRRALLSALRRRVRFVTHWLYYAAIHGTTEHATWACHHKGITWN